MYNRHFVTCYQASETENHVYRASLSAFSYMVAKEHGFSNGPSRSI
jgi:hypothetical protein